MIEVSDSDLALVETLLEELEERTNPVPSIDELDPVALCAAVRIIARLALLICNILQPSESA